MDKYPLEPEKPANIAGARWATELFRDRGLDLISDAPVDEAISLVTEGVDRDEVRKFLEAKDTRDPNILLKNKLLAMLLEISDGHGHELAADFLSLLELQAGTFDDQPVETRHRQFMGLLDIIVACFTNEELRRLFEEQKNSLNYILGPADTP